MTFGALLSHQAGLLQSQGQIELDLRFCRWFNPTPGLCFLLLNWPSACTTAGLLFQGKCIASLREDPAEDSLCLACFYCATTVQGLELDLRFCDGKLDCFYC